MLMPAKPNFMQYPHKHCPHFPLFTLCDTLELMILIAVVWKVPYVTIVFPIF